ncbi:MAG: carbohydrate ABC transporter permease [Fimbriimonas sp.]|nr:carbohydrate ABC transporter permease [Fimbriimonas sp.]
MKHRRSVGEHAFDWANTLVLALLGLLAVYPFLYVLSISLSTAAEAQSHSLHLYPRRVSWNAYRIVFESPDILRSLWNSIVRTALGTVITVLATCVAAYPLARKELPHRSLILFLILLTMIFSGGIVPGYLLVRSLGMINTIWALVIPGALSAFNVIVVKNFFQQIPESLLEAARVEGAGEWRILFRFFIPLSKPVLATIALWTAVSHWNQWFDAMLYITDDRKQVLQNMLQRIVIENSTRLIDMGKNTHDVASYTPETVKAATVVITVLPMLILYPFVQRYFAKGIMIGGVKE